jgi:endonuclease-8
VILATDDVQVIGFQLHGLKLLPTGEILRLVEYLGPDLLDPQWTDEHANRVTVALAADPARELGLALLDQRIMAGIGNLYKAEMCFLLKVSPWTPVAKVNPARVVVLGRKLLLANAWRHEQCTTGDMARGPFLTHRAKRRPGAEISAK